MLDSLKRLDWKVSSNGHVQIADSTITADGAPLRWYLGGHDSHWGVSLAPTGQPAVKNIYGTVSEEAAKQAAQQFETDNAGQTVHFSSVEILERYHLVGGETVTRVFATRPEAAYLGELHVGYARPLAEKLARARKKDKVLRLFTETGMALVPARQVIYVEIVQRGEDGAEFRGEPGWPPHMADDADEYVEDAERDGKP